MNVLVDLDGVLGDFATPACALFGKKVEELDFATHGFNIYDCLGISATEFWTAINEKGHEFWCNIEPYPWARQLWEQCERFAAAFGGRAYVVTSPSRDPSCHKGKKEWMLSFFGYGFGQYVMTSHKHLLARKDAVLIDDYEKNQRAFQHAGGHSIPFPRPWNSLGQSDWQRHAKPTESAYPEVNLVLAYFDALAYFEKNAPRLDPS